MAEQIKPCPGCGRKPFVDLFEDETRPRFECNMCSFRALDSDWQRRTPGPATKAILDVINGCLNVAGIAEVYIDEATARAFHAEWSESPEMKKAAASAVSASQGRGRIVKIIWKYRLDVTDEQLVSMIQDAEILAVQVQNGIPCIWALIDPSKPTEERKFRIYGTGYPIEHDPGQYIDTFQLHGGSLMFHLFEVSS